jgi:hypothetical protein
MSLDPLEKERLRRKMAQKMAIFQETAPSVECVSAHYYIEPSFCELCQTPHANELIIVKNRKNKSLRVALPCLKEMIRFKVTDVLDLPKWLDKLRDLRADAEKRKVDEETARTEQRKLLEKKVIIRKRTDSSRAP